jgi:hypothetical protein
MWGVIYLAFSLYWASLPPFVYSGFCAIGFLVLRITNKLQLVHLKSSIAAFRQLQLVLILTLPLSMQIVLGGLNGSRASCVMAWSIIAPAGSIFYCHRPAAFVSPSVITARGLLGLFRRFAADVGQSFPVLADGSVAGISAAFVALSALLIASQPAQPRMPDPPLILRQVLLATRSLLLKLTENDCVAKFPGKLTENPPIFHFSSLQKTLKRRSIRQTRVTHVVSSARRLWPTCKYAPLQKIPPSAAWRRPG